MTVGLMSIAFVAILGALGTLIKASAVQRDDAKANTAVISAAEAVKAADMAPCPDEAAAAAAYTAYIAESAALPEGWTVTVEVSCAGDDVQDVTVHTSSRGTEEELTVAKFEAPNATTPTTPTTTPVPGECIVTGAYAFDFGGSALVFAVAPRNQPTCEFPLRARREGGSGAGAALIRGGDLWFNFVPLGGSCSGSSCRMQILDDSGNVIIAVQVYG